MTTVGDRRFITVTFCDICVKNKMSFILSSSSVPRSFNICESNACYERANELLDKTEEEKKKMTQYPSKQERRSIQASADQGDDSAHDYLALLDACIKVLEDSDGISLARGMVGEHNDIYAQAIDDALSDLMPIIFKISAGGWDSLKSYVHVEAQYANTDLTKGSYHQDQERAQAFLLENQEYLNQAMQKAEQSRDPRLEAEAILQYHQAMLYALAFLDTGTDCACQPIIDELSPIAQELDKQRAAYARSPDGFGVDEMKSFIATCLSRLARVKDLCDVCQERMTYTLLAQFRHIDQKAHPPQA